MSPDDRQKPFHPRQTIWARSGGSRTAPLVRTLSTTCFSSGVMTEGTYCQHVHDFHSKDQHIKRRAHRLNPLSSGQRPTGFSSTSNQ